ncbi:rhodanese-like domain-containing protein [Candidatus Woesearchaeota archaeon]|nr:rhodanese-like domain-containing protein [Candidatus Woesearchaeota archaeon]
MKAIKIIILAVIFGAIAGALASFIILNFKTTNQLIKDFYLTENAVHVSPHSIRKAMDTGDKNFILVDLRSGQEYEKEHIIGAISIPAYKDPDTSAYGDVERIVGEFSKLPKDKDIIVYCYSIPCMTGRKIGKMLAEHGIYVKHLGIGWNEWKYYWNLWNHEHEWNATKVQDYTWSGKEPGTPKIKINSQACPIQGSFGC